MTTLTYKERNEAYRTKMLEKLTTHYKGWKILKIRTVVKPVNDCIQVLEYIIRFGDFQEACYTMKDAMELIDRYEASE